MGDKKEDRKKHQDISLRAAKFCQYHFIDGMDKKNAALKAGYALTSATVNPKRFIVQTDPVQRWIKDHLKSKTWTNNIEQQLARILTSARKDCDRLKSIEIWSRMVKAYRPESEDDNVNPNERDRSYRDVIECVESGQLPSEFSENSIDGMQEEYTHSMQDEYTTETYSPSEQGGEIVSAIDDTSENTTIKE